MAQKVSTGLGQNPAELRESRRSGGSVLLARLVAPVIGGMSTSKSLKGEVMRSLDSAERGCKGKNWMDALHHFTTLELGHENVFLNFLSAAQKVEQKGKRCGMNPTRLFYTGPIMAGKGGLNHHSGLSLDERRRVQGGGGRREDWVMRSKIWNGGEKEEGSKTTLSGNRHWEPGYVRKKVCGKGGNVEDLNLCFRGGAERSRARRGGIREG